MYQVSKSNRFTQYIDDVLEYLEYLLFPDLVIYFNEADVARSMSETMKATYALGMSPRMSAIIIWSVTMNYQIMIPSITH